MGIFMNKNIPEENPFFRFQRNLYIKKFLKLHNIFPPKQNSNLIELLMKHIYPDEQARYLQSQLENKNNDYLKFYMNTFKFFISKHMVGFSNVCDDMKDQVHIVNNQIQNGDINKNLKNNIQPFDKPRSIMRFTITRGFICITPHDFLFFYLEYENDSEIDYKFIHQLNYITYFIPHIQSSQNDPSTQSKDMMSKSQAQAKISLQSTNQTEPKTKIQTILSGLEIFSKSLNGTSSLFRPNLIMNASVRHKIKGLRIFRWPLIFIRRYGAEDDMFGFACGKHCLTGPGEFRFKTKNCTSIYEMIQLNLQHIFNEKKAEKLLLQCAKGTQPFHSNNKSHVEGNRAVHIQRTKHHRNIRNLKIQASTINTECSTTKISRPPDTVTKTFSRDYSKTSIPCSSTKYNAERTNHSNHYDNADNNFNNKNDGDTVPVTPIAYPPNQQAIESTIKNPSTLNQNNPYALASPTRNLRQYWASRSLDQKWRIFKRHSTIPSTSYNHHQHSETSISVGHVSKNTNSGVFNRNLPTTSSLLNSFDNIFTPNYDITCLPPTRRGQTITNGRKIKKWRKYSSLENLTQASTTKTNAINLNSSGINNTSWLNTINSKWTFDHTKDLATQTTSSCYNPTETLEEYKIFKQNSNTKFCINFQPFDAQHLSDYSKYIYSSSLSSTSDSYSRATKSLVNQNSQDSSTGLKLNQEFYSTHLPSGTCNWNDQNSKKSGIFENVYLPATLPTLKNALHNADKTLDRRKPIVLYDVSDIDHTPIGNEPSYPNYIEVEQLTTNDERSHKPKTPKPNKFNFEPTLFQEEATKENIKTTIQKPISFSANPYLHHNGKWLNCDKTFFTFDEKLAEISPSTPASAQSCKVTLLNNLENNLAINQTLPITNFSNVVLKPKKNLTTNLHKILSTKLFRTTNGAKSTSAIKLPPKNDLDENATKNCLPDNEIHYKHIDLEKTWVLNQLSKDL